MKIRKLLPILVVAVVAVVALSSCDNILAGLFNLHPAGTDSVTVMSTPTTLDITGLEPTSDTET